MNKRYYWLKLMDDFFTSKRIKKLRNLAGGDTYTIIYLKMQLKALKTDGYLYFDGIMDDFAEELALDLDEKEDDVRITINYLLSVGLLEMGESEKEYKLTYMDKLIGSEGASAQKVRDFREREKEKEKLSGDIKKPEPKNNALRQKMFRAKENCNKKQHIPMIEDYINNKRYSGNYYLVFQRDKYKCALCGSIENLCVHHIDGYDEEKPQNNSVNKMLTLCRCCHSNVHSGVPIPEDILDSIDYYSNEMLPCNPDVTEMKPTCNGEIEIDIEKDKELEIEKEIEKDKEKREKNKKQSAERIVEMYHIQCPSLPKVMKLTESRIRAINARLKEFTEEDIETAFVKAENSPFLRGEKGDWKANFDWIMKPGNLPKILEGNYDDREQVKKDSFDSMLEDWAKGGSDGKERVFGFGENDESSASGNVSGE